MSLLFCPVPLQTAEMFLPRPPVALWSQEAGGRDTLGAVLLSLPAPTSRKSIHPTTVVDRHKQQRRRLVDLLRHINMLWAKGARSSGRALRDAPGPAPHGHGAISGQILYRRACSQFSMRSKWSSSTPSSKVAPPAIIWQPEALVVRLLPDRIIRSDRGGEALDGDQHQQQLPRLQLWILRLDADNPRR